MVGGETHVHVVPSWSLCTRHKLFLVVLLFREFVTSLMKRQKGRQTHRLVSFGLFCMEPIEGGESARRKQPPPAAVWTVCAPLGPPKPAARLTGRLGSELSRAQCIEGEVKTAGGRWGGAVWGHQEISCF